ncbi:triose-phosphate isomerase [Candidatus Peregrinibacteria bacterium]|nr:triose-phosphate isomerase [Candidatus Peregrinibacteria bacterium]
MPRTRLIAANWKMNPPPAGWNEADSPYRPRTGLDVVVFPSFVDLDTCMKAGLTAGAQCGRSEEKGAFTGDVSMRMLKGPGCRYVLCGHSERRKFHRETDGDVAAQAAAAFALGITPVLCIGESAEERESGNAQKKVREQLQNISFPVVIAYEPVWAIGTGKSADPKNAQEMHAFIRSLLASAEGKRTRILYGGSVNEKNAAGFLAEPDIDGFLVGGASLDPAAFRAIVEAAAQRP